MSYHLYIVESGSGQEYKIAQGVVSLEACTTLVNQMDQLYGFWEALGFPEHLLGDDHWLKHFEGCDVYAEGDDGRTWSFPGDEGDTWEPLG